MYTNSSSCDQTRSKECTEKCFDGELLTLITESDVLFKISGVSGEVGAIPAATPVEDTRQGPAPVSLETVSLTTRAVLESRPRPWTVSTPTQVVFLGFIRFTEVTCRYSDYRLQPGGDLPTFHPGDFLPTRHPRQSPSVALSDRDSSVWRGLSCHLLLLSGAQPGRRWLEEFL